MPAGRPQGTRNKRSQALVEHLKEKFPHWDPVIQMAETAQNQELAPELRLQAAKEVAQYVHPKLRHTEHSGSGGGPILINTSVPTDAGL